MDLLSNVLRVSEKKNFKIFSLLDPILNCSGGHLGF